MLFEAMGGIATGTVSDISELVFTDVSFTLSIVIKDQS
jgi:hypothetical protein